MIFQPVKRVWELAGIIKHHLVEQIKMTTKTQKKRRKRRKVQLKVWKWHFSIVNDWLIFAFHCTRWGILKCQTLVLLISANQWLNDLNSCWLSLKTQKTCQISHIPLQWSFTNERTASRTVGAKENSIRCQNSDVMKHRIYELN